MRIVFRYHDLRRANLLLGNPRFRAAYDFLCLRAQAGEELQDECDWWTRFQEVTPEERADMCKGAAGKKGNFRRKKKRKPSNAKAKSSPAS